MKTLKKRSFRSLSIERLESRTLLSVAGPAPLQPSLAAAAPPQIDISAAWLAANGPAPYLLSTSGATYVLQDDVTTAATAFIFGGPNITLDLNGHAVTYDNAAPMLLGNAGFEQGAGRSVPGWNLAGAPDAAIAANTTYLWGSQVLQFSNISHSETVLSSPAAIPAANQQYTASIVAQGPDGSASTLSVIDALTGAVLASGAGTPGNAFADVVSFVPATTDPVELQVSVAPPSGSTATMYLDETSLTASHNFGLIASNAFWNIAPQLQNSTLDAAMQTAANATIENGSIDQGQAGSYGSLPIYGEDIAGLTIQNVNTLSTGIDTGAVDASYASSVSILGSTFNSSSNEVTNRMLGSGAMLKLFDAATNVLIQGNTLLNAPQAGIWDLSTVGLTISNNVIQSNTIVTDGYGITLEGVQNFVIADNRITAGAGKSSRGIDITGDGSLPNPVDSNGQIYGNYVDVRERPNPEYLAVGLAETALRLNTSTTVGGWSGLSIHDNTFIARTDDAGVVGAIGGRLSWNNTTLTGNKNNLIEHNLFEGIVSGSDPSHWAEGFELDDMPANTSPLISGNTFESNQTALALCGDDGSVNGALDGNFVSDTFAASTDGAARTFADVQVGYWIYKAGNVRIIDPAYVGSAPTIVWSGSGTKNMATGSLLSVAVTDPVGAPVAGAAVTVKNHAGSTVFSGVTSASGQLNGVSVVTAISSQATSDPSKITTALQGPFTVQVSLTGYVTSSQTVSLAASTALPVTLAFHGTPNAPSNLKAASISATAVALSWSDNANNETGFSVERYLNGKWTVIAQLAANATTYTDGTAAANTSYKYRVRALNSIGYSGYSSTLSVKTLKPAS